MKKIIDFIKAHPLISKALHTFWQSFIAVFIVGLTPIVQNVLNGNIDLAKAGIIALITASVAAGFSALKTYILNVVK